MSKPFSIKFKLGRPPTSVVKYAIVGALLSILVATISQCTKIPKDKVQRIIDIIQRGVAPDSALNDYILKDPEWLDNRIKYDVDDALAIYKLQSGWTPVEMPDAVYSEKPIDPSVCYTEDCKTLGGEMRLCSPWIDGCLPKQ
jgi:hypothetical protein